MNPREYLWAWLWWTVLLLGNVVAFNLVVDPYGLFQVVDVPGVNRVKSQASERGSLFKHVSLERMHPSGLILGNSRAEIGFDPESPAWPPWARPVFNLALPGAGISAVAGDFAKALRGSTPSDWISWTSVSIHRPPILSRRRRQAPTHRSSCVNTCPRC